MSVKDGTRPGTSRNDNYPGWKHIECLGEWKTLRDNGHAASVFEGGINKAIADAGKLSAALHVAALMLHGGHVDKGVLARSGMRVDWGPKRVVDYLTGLLPKSVDAA